MFKQVRLNDAILKFYQRSQPIAFSNAETLYEDLVLLRDQILMYGDLSEAQTNYLNEFIEKFDNKLTSTTQEILSRWLVDGVLADIVREAINEEVINSRDGEASLNLRLNRDKQDTDTEINLLQEKDDQITARLTRNEKQAEVRSKQSEVRSKHKGLDDGIGAVVFVSDDVATSNENILIPLFIQKNVPLCLAVISGFKDRAGYMKDDRLLELQNNYGWEILSHSKTHYEGGTTIPDMTFQKAEAEYRDSKDALISRGFNIETYAVPGGRFSTRERAFGRKHYRAVRTSDKFINEMPIRTFELGSYWLDEAETSNQNFTFFKDLINETREKNALLIISTHGQGVTTQTTRTLFDQVIDYAKFNSRVMTLSSALDIYGNTLEVGDYSKFISQERKPLLDYYVIGANMVSESSYQSTFRSLDDDEVGVNTPYSEFPIGITQCAITQDTPNGTNGTLITYKNSLRGYGYNYQHFIPFKNANTVYSRAFTGIDTFTEWHVNGGIDYRYDLTSPQSEFKLGVTRTSITASNTGGTMDYEGGQLTTYINTKASSALYRNFQEFVSSNARSLYQRFGTLSGNWGPWIETGRLVVDNQTTLSSAYWKFKYGITSTVIDHTSTPSASKGVLLTYKIQGAPISGSWQEFVPYGKSEKYHRSFVSNDEGGHTAWTKFSGVVV